MKTFCTVDITLQRSNLTKKNITKQMTYVFAHFYSATGKLVFFACNSMLNTQYCLQFDCHQKHNMFLFQRDSQLTFTIKPEQTIGVILQHLHKFIP